MHESVLLEEAIQYLNIIENGIYVDATLGYGGHSNEILRRLKRGFLFAFDQDSEAILISKNKLEQTSSNFKIIHSNFKDMKNQLALENINEVDGIIFDLGVSSPQIDDGSRGFSFMKNAKLDMRMDQESHVSAYEIINYYSDTDLFKIFISYGEEKFSKPIAKKIVELRKTKQIETTFDLVDVIKAAVPFKYYINNHPERRIFQAIRIEVNKELDVLKKTLPEAIKLLKPKGRLVVITFHSLEDRIVKNIFKEYTDIPDIIKGDPNISDEYLPKYKLVTTKPIIPSEKEMNNNRRSQSAKLRVIERI